MYRRERWERAVRWRCPRCGGWITPLLTEGEVANPQKRAERELVRCSDCGRIFEADWVQIGQVLDEDLVGEQGLVPVDELDFPDDE